MSTEKETLRRVQDALFHLRNGLDPFVAAKMQQRHGAKWLHYASRAHGASPNAALDVYGLLKTMLDNWNELFRDHFAPHERHDIRGFVTVANSARNNASHASKPLGDNEALRFLDAILELMKAVKAPPSEIKTVDDLYAAQRNAGLSAAAPVTPEPAKLAVPVRDVEEAPGLKPWIKVVKPHGDVAKGRLTDSEFAADLFAVDSGEATDEYGSAQSFFRITFLTDGLKRVLISTLQRLSRAGGDPIIGLQTSFGGGKTHTMLAVYHLAQSATLDGLAGIETLAKEAGVTQWQKPRVAAFVGTSKGTDVSLVLKDGPRVHTIWGYIAWRLAGEDGLTLMAEAEAARTNPGSELLVELFKLAGPSVILLDELVAYARQLPEERFEAFLSFIQSLTEAAKMVPGVLVIGSLPESDAEAGRDKGKTALLRLEKVFGRVQSPWLPASGDETYEIIRRRLFQELDSEVARRERDATVKAFAEMYRIHAAEFPPFAKEARYAELLRLSYPIHPELFDRLAKDWASLEKFQRTRGVLRFMANVINVLWKAQVGDSLIMPGRVPIANERVKAAILHPLEPGFGAVIDKEVDGDFSLPGHMETNPQRRITQMQAATRAARAVFLGSAPLSGQPNAGINGLALRLACAEPGDQLAIFGEAVRELAEQATYLHGRSGLYWFSTQPTLNRLAEERAKAFAEHEVDAAIRDVLVEDGNVKGGFHRVFAAPDDPAAMDEVQSIALVILGPGTPHSGKGAVKSAATDVVTEALTRCRASQRRFRNTLLFVAADETKLGEARQAMRRSLAWKSIGEDRALQGQITQSQMADAAETAKASRQRALAMIRAAWSHVIYPYKTDATAAGSAFELEHLLVTPKEGVAIPAAVYEKASVKGDAIIKATLGAQTLWKELKPLWGEDRPHLAVNEIAEWFASYVYLPKLRDRPVLEAAIRDAAGKLDAEFGYAEQFDEASGRYVGLVWKKLPPDPMPASAVIVRADTAAAHQPPKQNIGDVTSPGHGGGLPDQDDFAALPNEPKAPPQPRRFYGSVEIDPARPVKSFDTILNAVVMELQRGAGTRVTLTLEIAAEAPAGFPEADIGVVRDNARQLKFKTESTGFE